MKHLINIKDLLCEDALHILKRADLFRQNKDFPRFGFSVLLAFFQPSTRTRIGFASATSMLGGTPIDLYSLKYDVNMSEEESIADTIRCASGQVDLMVLRHRDKDLHAGAVSAAVCPVINGGNGNLEHPTQALVDLYAILKNKGRVDGLRIGLVGDLGSRAAHSLISALSWFRPDEIRLMNPPGREILPEWLVGAERLPVSIMQSLNLANLDVIYMVGLPAGTGEGALSAEDRSKWALSKETIPLISSEALVLCPLPRIDEIDIALDNDPRGCYFKQSDDGLFVRMAVLEWIKNIN